MAKVKVLVLTGYGLNCDDETAHAFEQAGDAAHRAHINSVIYGSVRLEDHHILVFIGGFSWGDDHGAGVFKRSVSRPISAGACSTSSTPAAGASEFATASRPS